MIDLSGLIYMCMHIFIDFKMGLTYTYGIVSFLLLYFLLESSTIYFLKF